MANKKETLKHLDFVLNVVCKEQIIKGFVVPPERMQLVKLDMQEGAQVMMSAQEERAKEARPGDYDKAVVYGWDF